MLPNTLRFGRGDSRMSSKPRKAKRAAARRQAPRTSERLGYRLHEFCALTGVSETTVWRWIRDKQIKIVTIGSVKIVPKSEAVRLGLL